MNIHMDGNLSLPFDENQTIGVRKSGLKHSLQQSSDGGFPVKAKGLGGSAVKKQRRALGDVSESQINARQKGTRSSDQKSSKLNISVTKPSAKAATPTIFVQKSSPMTDRTSDMACSGAGAASSHQRDLQLEVDRMAAKRCSSLSSKPGLSYPSKNIGIRKSSSSSSRTHLQEEVTAILNETSGVFSFTAGAGVGLDHDEKSEAPVPSSSANSFLSEIFDDQSINDLLND